MPSGITQAAQCDGARTRQAPWQPVRNTTAPEVNPLAIEEGVFLPEEWQFEHGIEDMSDPEPETIKHAGTVIKQTVYMGDGSVYRIRDGRPEQQAIEQASVATTAFLTRDDRGINPHIQAKEMEAGGRALLISRELEWEGNLDQARTAHNMLLIARAVFEDDGTVDPENMEFRGISRGAMLALGAKAMSEGNPRYGINVYYFNAIAPCYPNPLEISTEYLKMPLCEGLSLGYHLGRLPISIMAQYPRSLDLNPDYIWAGAKALSNGDAGRFVEYIPEDQEVTNGYIEAYSDDIMGQGKTWQKKFDKHHGVYVDLKKQRLPNMMNGHLRVVSGNDLEQDLARQARLKEESQRTAGDIVAIDFEYVNLGQAA